MNISMNLLGLGLGKKEYKLRHEMTVRKPEYFIISETDKEILLLLNVATHPPLVVKKWKKTKNCQIRRCNEKDDGVVQYAIE